MKSVFRRGLRQLSQLACLNLAFLALPGAANFDHRLYEPFVRLQESVEEVAAIYEDYYGMPGINPETPLPEAAVKRVQAAVGAFLADYREVKDKVLGQLKPGDGRACRAGFDRIESQVLPKIKTLSQDPAHAANGYSNGFRYLVGSVSMLAADFSPDCILSAQSR